MRHYLHLCGPPCTPTTRAQGVLEAPGKPSLVAPTGVTLQRATSARCAAIGTIALTPITVTADQDLLATTRAQEESGSLVRHAHPRQYRRCAGRDRPRVQQLRSTRRHWHGVGRSGRNKLPVRAAAAPAYFGMMALQRRCSAHQPCPTRRSQVSVAPTASAAHQKLKLPLVRRSIPGWPPAGGHPGM